MQVIIFRIWTEVPTLWILLFFGHNHSRKHVSGNVCLFVCFSGGGSSTHNFFSFVTTTRSVIFTYSLCLNDTHHGTVVRTKEGNVGISLRVAPLLCSVLRPSQTRTTPGRHANSDQTQALTRQRTC